MLHGSQNSPVTATLTNSDQQLFEMNNISQRKLSCLLDKQWEHEAAYVENTSHAC